MAETATLLATRAALLSAVLGVVYRKISGPLLTQAGLTRTSGHTGAVTLIQRFGSAAGATRSDRARRRECLVAWRSRAGRITVGPRAGQKVFTLRNVPAHFEGEGRNGAEQ